MIQLQSIFIKNYLITAKFDYNTRGYLHIYESKKLIVIKASIIRLSSIREIKRLIVVHVNWMKFVN